MFPIHCQILGPLGAPLPSIHVLLEYLGTEFEAYTSHAGIADGWFCRDWKKQCPRYVDVNGCRHCSLAFSCGMWGTIRVERWLSENRRHIFVLHLGDREINHFSTSLSCPFNLFLERALGGRAKARSIHQVRSVNPNPNPGGPVRAMPPQPLNGLVSAKSKDPSQSSPPNNNPEESNPIGKPSPTVSVSSSGS